MSNRDFLIYILDKILDITNVTIKDKNIIKFKVCEDGTIEHKVDFDDNGNVIVKE